MAQPPVSIQLSAADLPAAAAPVGAFNPPGGIAPSFDAAARNYVNLLIAQPPNKSFSDAAAQLEGRPPALTFSGLTNQDLTGTVVAEYTQNYKGVPLYGQPLGVEMEKDTSFVGVGGAIGLPLNLDPIASISPKQALATARAIAGLASYESLPDVEAPQLAFRYDPRRKEWNLVYVFEGIPIKENPPQEARGRCGERGGEKSAAPVGHEHEGTGLLFSVYRVFIDAHSGLEVARVALRKNALVPCVFNEGGVALNFNAEEGPPGTFSLFDSSRKVRTMTLGFDDVNCGPKELPGIPVETTVANAGNPVFGNRAAILAHHRAAAVFDFFRDVLRRNSIDGNGMEVVSVVDCTDYRHNGLTCGPRDATKQEWKNAAWIRDTRPFASSALRVGLMVYGQSRWTTDNKLHSFAESLDVVGHELTHGITDYTSNLEYVTESGALNESYSDIIGIAISNAAIPNVADWNWELGEDLSENGQPTRNLQDPHLGKAEFRFSYGNQPDHMNEFLKLAAGEPPSRFNDNGYVHYNSGIHNKAAYNLFSSPRFTWQEVVQMFYMTLTTPGRLSRLATFHESREGMIASCKSLFRNEAAATRNPRLDAVARAFDAVGIV